MKFRNAFVSNSSTCSFVILGLKVTDEEAEEIFKDELAKCKDEDEREEELYELTRDQGVPLYDDGGYIIGEIIARETDYRLSSAQHTIEELNDIAKQLAEKYNVGLEKISLYAGTRMC